MVMYTDKEIKNDEDIFVIRDSENNYVDKNSLFLDNKGMLNYSSSKTILNGCCYFKEYDIAEKHLDILNHLNSIHNGNFKFSIVKENYNELIRKELFN